MVNIVDISAKVAEIQELATTISVMKNDILPYLSNKEISLETRWDWYCNLVQYGAIQDIESYGDGHLRTLDPNVSLYDDFYLDRYTTKYYVDLYTDMILDGCKEYPADAIDAWREEVLKSGDAGFCFDW